MQSRLLVLLEGIVALGYIAKDDNDYIGADLGKGCIQLDDLHKELQEEIIDAHGPKDHYAIPESLHPSWKVGFLEYHVTAQVETNGERDPDGKKVISCNMRFKGKVPDMHNLLLEHIGIANMVKDYAHQCIETATSCIAIGLYGHYPPENGIECIHYREQEVLCMVVYFTHALNAANNGN